MTVKQEKDPEKYLQAYEWGLRSFLPAAAIEDFRNLVDNTINERRRYWEESFRNSDATWQDSDNPYEAFKDRCYDEARIEELNELQFLADELLILGLYRFIEIERNRVLCESFKTLDQSRLSNFSYLNKSCPFLSQLFGFAEIDELRLITNCIKHSGLVSVALAKRNSCWREGEPLGALRTAYERLAPFVHAYWVDLVQKARKHRERLNDT